ncbi:MAG: hypothetical protein V2A73_15420 [Pseudomonadota bacterium]
MRPPRSLRLRPRRLRLPRSGKPIGALAGLLAAVVLLGASRTVGGHDAGSAPSERSATVGDGVNRPEPWAAGVTVRVRETRVELGRPFSVVIAAVSVQGDSIDLPPSLPLGETLREVGRTVSEEAAPGRGHRRVFEISLVAFQLGRQAIPPLPLLVVAAGERQEMLAGGLEIEVVSVIGQGKEELKPIAPPLSIAGPVWFGSWLGYVAGALVAVTAMLVLLRRIRSGRRAETTTPGAVRESLPPDVLAIEKLRALAAAELMAAEDRRPLYFAMSEIVRTYLGRRFGFDALELTTSELLEALDKTAAGYAAHGLVQRWLEDCDLVKYAAVPANLEQALAAIEEGVAIVERTRYPFVAGERAVAVAGVA